MMLSRVATRSSAGRRLMSTQPNLIKAKHGWKDIASKRKIDEDDTHLCFHPPFNAGAVFLLVGSVIALGIGTMQYGFVHQQYKQGFWK